MTVSPSEHPSLEASVSDAELATPPTATATGTAVAAGLRTWTPVCAYTDLLPERGACALILDGHRIAIFRTFDGALYAIGNRDRFAGPTCSPAASSAPGAASPPSASHHVRAGVLAGQWGVPGRPGGLGAGLRDPPERRRGAGRPVRPGGRAPRRSRRARHAHDDIDGTGEGRPGPGARGAPGGSCHDALQAQGSCSPRAGCPPCPGRPPPAARAAPHRERGRETRVAPLLEGPPPGAAARPSPVGGRAGDGAGRARGVHRRGDRDPAARGVRGAARTARRPGGGRARHQAGAALRGRRPARRHPGVPGAPVDDVVVTTGVGFRGWMAAAEGWGLSAELAGHLAGPGCSPAAPRRAARCGPPGSTTTGPPASPARRSSEYLLAQDIAGGASRCSCTASR